MIPLLEVQPGVWVNVMHVDHFRIYPMEEGDGTVVAVMYHLRETPEEKWIRVHPECQEMVMRVIRAMYELHVVPARSGIAVAKTIPDA